MRTRYRVMVVEDEPRMRELLVRAIAGWGFESASARSGEEALRGMEGETAQVMVLDLNLPAMSGMEVFEAVRQKWPGTQVVILTGFGDLETARQAIHLDVVEFLTKPCHLGELEQALDRARQRLDEALPLPDLSQEGEQEEPAPIPAPKPDGAATRLDDIEREHILAALARNQGNRTATASELGISLRTLYYRLSEYQKQGYSID